MTEILMKIQLNYSLKIVYMSKNTVKIVKYIHKNEIRAYNISVSKIC